MRLREEFVDLSVDSSMKEEIDRARLSDGDLPLRSRRSVSVITTGDSTLLGVVTSVLDSMMFVLNILGWVDRDRAVDIAAAPRRTIVCGVLTTGAGFLSLECAKYSEDSIM